MPNLRRTATIQVACNTPVPPALTLFLHSCVRPSWSRARQACVEQPDSACADGRFGSGHSAAVCRGGGRGGESMILSRISDCDLSVRAPLSSQNSNWRPCRILGLSGPSAPSPWSAGSQPFIAGRFRTPSGMGQVFASPPADPCRCTALASFRKQAVRQSSAEASRWHAKAWDSFAAEIAARGRCARQTAAAMSRREAALARCCSCSVLARKQIDRVGPETNR